MAYDETIKLEARYAENLGPDATEDNYAPTYSTILKQWFPASKGYMIDYSVFGHEKESIVVRHPGSQPDPLLIVELKRPGEWNDAGKTEMAADIATYIERQLAATQYNTVYGVGAIGLHWAVYMVEKTGRTVQEVLGWQEDISSDESFAKFEILANLVYNIQ